MKTIRRFLAAFLVSILALATAGCDQNQIARWCSAYQRGSAWAFAAIPALDIAAGLAPPEWAERYRLARAGLLTVHGSLVAACERRAAGGTVTREIIERDLLAGVQLITDLIELQRELGGTRDVEAAPVEALLADLEQTKVEIKRSMP